MERQNESINTYERNLEYATQQGVDFLKSLAELNAMIFQAQKDGVQIPESVKSALEKFAPMAENEKALLNLKGEISKAKSDMFEAGVKITQEDVARLIEEHVEITSIIRGELGI